MRTFKNNGTGKIRFGIMGYGRFGKLWAEELSRFGEVLACDNKFVPKTGRKNIKPSAPEETARADILFLAVPISEVKKCCRDLEPFLQPGTLVADTCSVKAEPAKILIESFSKKQPIIATHPLFGPDSAKRNGGIKGLKIVVCRLRKNPKEKEAIGLFRKMGLEIIFSTPEKHDRAMASSQALVHLIGKGLEALNLKRQKISTPDYPSLLHMYEMVSNDTWQLFFDMQRRNPYAAPLRDKFLDKLEDIDLKVHLGEDDIFLLRKGIEEIDKKIIKLIGARDKFSKKIGLIKKEKGLKVFDSEREAGLERFRGSLSRKYKAEPLLIEKMFRDITENSRKIQMP